MEKKDSNGKIKQVYYSWICPQCGDDSCCDPLFITSTQCKNGHSVILSDYVKYNMRKATLRSCIEESNVGNV